MQNSNISFTANIRLVTWKTYFNEVQKIGIKNGVNEPWTAKEIIKRPNAYTTDISICTAGGVLDGSDVTMHHICPTPENIKNSRKTLRVLSKKIGAINNEMSSLLVGSMEGLENNKIFQSFSRFIKRRKIPCTKLQELKECRVPDTNILCKAKEKEWLINNEKISEEISKKQELLKTLSPKELQKELKKILEGCFNKVEIAPCDTLSL